MIVNASVIQNKSRNYNQSSEKEAGIRNYDACLKIPTSHIKEIKFESKFSFLKTGNCPEKAALSPWKA